MFQPEYLSARPKKRGRRQKNGKVQQNTKAEKKWSDIQSNKQIDEKNCRLCSLHVRSSHLPSSFLFSSKFSLCTGLNFLKNYLFASFLLFTDLVCSCCNCSLSFKSFSFSLDWLGYYTDLFESPNYCCFLSSLCNARNEQIRDAWNK